MWSQEDGASVAGREAERWREAAEALTGAEKGRVEGMQRPRGRPGLEP